MRYSLFPILMILLFAVTACSSTPIDVELAGQNYTNIETTNDGTIELMDLLDRAKTAHPDADWTAEWGPHMRDSHLLQSEANRLVAGRVLERAKAANRD